MIRQFQRVLDQLRDELSAAHDRIAQIEVRNASQHLQGPVLERDHEKGVRIQIGEDADGKPVKSPWLQPPDISGVTRYLPQVGEQYTLAAPDGDLERATLIPLTHTDKKKNPAGHADEVVLFNMGKIKLSVDTKVGTVTLKNDKSTTTWHADKTMIDQDGKTTTYTKDQITFPDGSKVKHGQKSIGQDHKHSGVQPGGGNTSVPED